MDLFKIERFGIEEHNENSVRDQQLRFQQQIEKRKMKMQLRKSGDRTKKKKKNNTESEKEALEGDDLKIPSKKKKKANAEFEKETVDENDLKTPSKKKKKTNREHEKETLDSNDLKTPISDSVDFDQSDIISKETNDMEDSKEINEADGMDEHISDDDSAVQDSSKSNDELVSFPILTKQQYATKTKIKRNLPRWLAEPKYLSTKYFPINEIDFLSKNTVDNLQKMDISNLFPVQASVIPFVLEMYKRRKLCYPCQDVCVQSPTGSGKTLSYVLPIMEILSANVIRELQCLIVLPSKELAVQVKQTIDQCVLGTNLKVGLIAGIKSFRKEQQSLIISRGKGTYSLVDILVSSPGRLVDHLKFTPGFVLSKLKFLVVDEADRLLSENYDNWLELIYKSIQSENDRPLFPLNASRFSKPISHVQKFLFSATLTEDPEKLAPLQLFNPILFLSPTMEKYQDDQDSGNTKTYSLPEKLVEKMLVVEPYQKPIALLHLVLAFDYKCILCFTNTKESTHRLFLLLQQFDGIKASEFSSHMNETRRKAVLRDFRAGKLNLLIATDAMSRGMDIKNVDLVVNYDAPFNTKTYIHRIGRTARGGEEGEAITILVEKEVHYFKKMHQSFPTSQNIKNIGFSQQQLSVYEETYQRALLELKTKLQNEKKKF